MKKKRYYCGKIYFKIQKKGPLSIFAKKSIVNPIFERKKKRHAHNPLIINILSRKLRHKMNVIVVAVITAKPEFTENVKENLLYLVEMTHQEAACITYDLHQNADVPNQFTMYEIWENEVGFQAHLQMPYLKEFGEKAKDWFEKPLALSKLVRLNEPKF
jgi:quinol monooxygenase YgiN